MAENLNCCVLGSISMYFRWGLPAHASWKEYPAGANGNALNAIEYEPSLIKQVELHYGRFLDFAATRFVNYYLDS